MSPRASVSTHAVIYLCRWYDTFSQWHECLEACHWEKGQGPGACSSMWSWYIKARPCDLPFRKVIQVHLIRVIAVVHRPPPIQPQERFWLYFPLLPTPCFLHSSPTGFWLGVEHTLGLDVVVPLFQTLTLMVKALLQPGSTSSSSQSPLATTDLLPLLCFSAKLSWLLNKSFIIFICSPYLLSVSSPRRESTWWWLALLFFFFFL